LKISLTEGFRERINGRFSKYSFEVGILKDRKYRKPASKERGLTSLARGPARRQSRETSKYNVSDISAFNRGDSSDYLRDPFRKPANQDQKLIKRFLAEFVKMTSGKSQIRRVENLLQAIVRNPMARGDYGTNARSVQRRKGFDRFMIDTGQLFRSVTARILKVGRRNV